MTELKPTNRFTRRIAREYKRILYLNIVTESDKNGDMAINFDPYSKELADEYLVKELFSIEDMDNLDAKEYEKMKKIALKVKDEAFL